jgi:hypothetical protein
MYSINDMPEYLTPNYLVSRINQEDIWFYYTGLSPEPLGLYKNPARYDVSAGCKFFQKSGYWWLTDFARGNKVYNCFTILKDIYNIPYPKVLEMVYTDFLGNRKELNYKTDFVYSPKTVKLERKIECKLQKYTKQDIEYLKSFHLTATICKRHHVYSVSLYWIDGIQKYSHKASDPCLGYFEEGKWKLYHYLREDYRFISNINSSMLQGMEQLSYKSSTLIITKSKKDVMVYDLLGMEAVAPHSEALSKWEQHLPNLIDKYSTIYLNFDNDKAGLEAANTVIDKYPTLIPLFIPIESGEKDISDYIKSYGIENTKYNLKKWLEK